MPSNVLDILASRGSIRAMQKKAELEEMAQRTLLFKEKLNEAKLKYQQDKLAYDAIKSQWDFLQSPEVQGALGMSEKVEGENIPDAAPWENRAMGSKTAPTSSLPEIMAILLQAMLKGGNVQGAMQVPKAMDDLATADLKRRFLGGQAGAGAQGAGAADVSQEDIVAAGRGDAGAIQRIIAANTIRKVVGLPEIAPNLIGMAKSKITPRSVTDKETGEKFTAAFDENKQDFIRDEKGEVKRFALEAFPEMERIETEDEKGRATQFFPKHMLMGPGARFQTAPPQIGWQGTEGPGGEKGAMAVPKFAPPGTQIQTAPEKGEAPDKAGRFTLAKMGVDAVRRIKDLVIKPDGTIDRDLILKYTSPVRIGKGRELHSLLTSAIESPLRAATGAVINKEELANYLSIYGPSYLDPDDLIIDKLERLFQFNMNFANQVDPSGGMAKRLGEKPDFRPKTDTPKDAPPVSLLKEGVNTKFKNGQTWTLRGGKPVRVK